MNRKRKLTPTPFSTWLTNYQGSGNAEEGLASKMGVSGSMLWRYLTKGELPRWNKTLKIAEKLGLDGDNYEAYFKAYSQSLAGVGESHDQEEEEQDILTRFINAVISKKNAKLKRPLLLKLDELLRIWVPAQSSGVKSAIIPIAGWQSEILSPLYVARLLRRAVDEVAHAKIERVVAIVAPGHERLLPQQEPLRNLRSPKIRYVPQKEKEKGLAAAVLTGWEKLDAEEAAVLVFPDEFPTKGDCVGSLVRVFDEKKIAVVGLSRGRQINAGEKSKWGIADCLEKRGKIRSITFLHEKPEPEELNRLENPLAILGRYVLTERVITELKKGDEFTSALNKLVKTKDRMICGYVFGESMKRIPINLNESVRKNLDKVLENGGSSRSSS